MCNACDKPKYYITTAIAYASSKPHIGNVYDIIMADAIARYKRQRGYDVFLCTGTDEHGQKIELKAAEAGITPKEFVDNISGQIKAVWDGMNVSYNRFIRTTDPDHEEAIAHIFQKFYDQGDIYKDAYEGWYCTPCESFITDSQLVDGKCPDCGREVIRTKEEAYYFRMSKYADWLIDYIESHPGFIEPEARQKEMIGNFLKPGLQDLCITRSNFRWGIPVPFDPGHVTYVWLDALCNYITALGYDPANEVQPENFQKYWPADVHVIGKDIMRFHSIYWTIFLHALGLPLPKKIFGHPWFKFGEDKMSKSRGNVIYSDELAAHFTVDGVRYYALAEMPYLNDGSITYESMVNRYNTDLANNLGNLVNRTIAMTKKYFGGIVPEPGSEEGPDAELKDACRTAVESFTGDMESFHLADACADIFTMLRRANKYIDETTPWTLAKSEETLPRLKTVIYNLLETIRTGAVLLTSLLPQTAESIFRQIGTDVTDFDSVSAFGALAPGKEVGEAVPLFQRIDEEALIAEWHAKQEEAKKAAEAAQPKTIEKPEGIAQIGIDDFMKVELRTAQILACEKVPKAKKLLKLQVDLGYEQRQVVSGIAKFYEPETLIGKKIILVANLKPAVLCGIESNGMILASGEDEVRVVFLSDDTPLGERVR
ncbi:MAG: methionine--tRNA ligase [Eubacteriales bacterium]|nr:methionine--tRNA ligase [Eubacteriales bacterium]MDY3940428.1 methionine--tRNA ligase [Eubacteriales bacterium]